MQTIPGGVNSWYVDSVVVSKRVRTFHKEIRENTRKGFKVHL
jgi:hypothetical protein